MANIYGYCRISTQKQSIERQVRNISNIYNDAHIIKEVFTGTKVDGRVELDKLLKLVKDNDTIIFDSVSRMSRNSVEGCELYETLFNQNVNLIFLKEPHINTSVYKDALTHQIDIKLNTGNAPTDDLMNSIIDALNKFTLDLAKEQIKIAFDQAEKEVKDLQQRVKEGIVTAKIDGKQIGQVKGSKLTTAKSKSAKSIIQQHSTDFGGSLNDVDCCKLAGVSRNSYYKYKRELKESMSI